jgi:hypothetical protein
LAGLAPAGMAASFAARSNSEVGLADADFRFNPDSVAKVVLPKVSKILRAVRAVFV